MTITAEVKGATADRFRAYAKAKMTRKPRVADHIKRAKAGKAALKLGTRIAYPVEEIAVQGSVTGKNVTLTAPEGVTITRVVFYAGPVEEEVCVGSADVGATGSIAIELVEPKDGGDVIEEEEVE